MLNNILLSDLLLQIKSKNSIIFHINIFFTLLYSYLRFKLES